MLLWIWNILACGEKKAETDTALFDTANDTSPSWNILIDADPRGAWLSAFAPTPADVWVVGGQPEEGKILRGNHRDGFTEFSLPLSLPTVPLLNWVHGQEDHLWVVGLHGSILEWNMDHWVDHSLAIDEAFWGVHSRETDDGLEVWAVGGSSRWGGTQGVVYRYHTDTSTPQGTWEEIALPPEVSSVSNLFKVTFDGNNYWIVGTEGTLLYGTADNLRAMPTGMTQDLITVWSDNENHALIVGGRGVGIFAEATMGNVDSVSQLIAGINGISYHNNEILLVGEMGYAIWNHRNTDGSMNSTEIPAVTRNILHASTAVVDSETDIRYAVGGNLATADSSYQGTILFLEMGR